MYYINFHIAVKMDSQKKTLHILRSWASYRAFIACILEETHGVMSKTTVAWWHHRATEIWVNIGSGNGLLPDGTKPLPEPMLIYHQ